MPEYNYEIWDKERRETYPEADHRQWETWTDTDRVAEFNDIECWVMPLLSQGSN